MVIVVRTDLGMSKGKVAAQCAHAAVACYKKALKQSPEYVQRWEAFGQAKVALKADGGEEVLNDLKLKAKAEQLATYIVRDAGRTQVEFGAATVLGIGPGPAQLVDKVDQLGIRENTLIIFQSDHGHSMEVRAHSGGGKKASRP